MRLWRAILLAGVVILAGCSEERSVEFEIDEEGEFADAEVTYAPGDQFAMLTEDGAVKLGLTSDHVYVELSEALREHVDQEIAAGMAESDSRIGRMIGSAVRKGVRGALDMDIDFRVAEIRDVDYRAGELVFEWEDPQDEGAFQNIEVDNEPVTRAFSEEDARAFVEAFRRVKRGEMLRPAAADDSSQAPDTAADTSGGASF